MEQIVRAYQEHIGRVLLERMKPGFDQVNKGLAIWVQHYVKGVDELFLNPGTNEKCETPIALLAAYMEFCRQMLPTLDQLHQSLPLARKEQLGYDQVLYDFLREQPRHLDAIQSQDRFNKHSGDSFYINAIKAYKRGVYRMCLIPVSVSRWFNKIVKKEVFIQACEVKPWKQRIPLRKLSIRYYAYDLFQAYSDILIDLHKDAALSISEIRLLDDMLYPAISRAFQQGKDVDSLKSEWKEQIRPRLIALQKVFEAKEKHYAVCFEKQLKHIDAVFWEQAQLAGTLEFNSIRHWSWMCKYKAKHKRRNIIQHIIRRKNTIYAICDDWKFSQEIYILSCNAIKNRYLFKEQLTINRQSLQKLLEEIPFFLQDTLRQLKPDTLQDLKKNLQQLKFNTGKILVNTIISKALGYVDQQELPDIIENKAQSLLKDLVLMTRKRSLIPHFDPSRAYPQRALRGVSPQKLIEFEIGSAWKRFAQQAKEEIRIELENIHAQLENLGRISLINLESAIVQLTDKKEQIAQVAYQDARSGLERALNQYTFLSDYTKKMYYELELQIEAAVDKFISSLLELAINENAEEIRRRIRRADLKKSITETYAAIRFGLLRLIKQTVDFLGLIRRETGAGIGTLRSKLGIQDQARDITSEISEFLAFDNEDIQNLPFVYQRLFSNEPLKENSFYLHRAKETQDLVGAYQKWSEGLFMPTLIYGEKGSGVSTLMEMFMQEKQKENLKLITIIPEKRLYSTGDLLVLLGGCLRKKAFSDLDDLYNYIDQQPAFCIFMDKLHFLYLRQPKGFEVLKLLFKIISSTSKKVFWVCSCGQYSADYLNKTIGLFGYFPVLIQMQSLELSRIIKIILLRHKASGYDMSFMPSVQDLADKKFLKKDPAQQQDLLENKYFSTLHQITESNISFALLLWLTSIHQIENNTVYLESLDKLDFSFLYTQTPEAVFGLNALLLHEALNVDELSAVLNCSERQANLLMMRLNDRGIVVSENGLFKIHPLLYRSCMQMLKVKNLIH